MTDFQEDDKKQRKDAAAYIAGIPRVKSELKRIKSQIDFNAIGILESHNKWRRGADIEMQSPYLLGLAIDEAIDALKRIKEIDLP